MTAIADATSEKVCCPKCGKQVESLQCGHCGSHLPIEQADLYGAVARQIAKMGGNQTDASRQGGNENDDQPSPPIQKAGGEEQGGRWYANRIRAHPNSESNPEFSTPDWLFEPLDKEFHFTLDVAASPANAKCDRYFTKEEDGLKQSWAGEVVWCNPPFSKQEIGEWVQKAYEESQNDSTVVVLIPSGYKGYRWWKTYCVEGQVRFIHEYVRFNRCDGNGTALLDVIVIVFGREYRPLSSGPVISRARSQQPVTQVR